MRMALIVLLLRPSKDRVSRVEAGKESGLRMGFQAHPAAADLFEAARILGGEGFLAEAVDLGGWSPGPPQAVANGAHQGVTVAAAQADPDLWIKRSHRGRFHTYNVRRAKNVSPHRKFPARF